MLKRVGGFLAYLLLALIVVAALAATTLAPSYRACADGRAAADPGSLSDQLRVFAECETEFLRNNEATLVAIAIVVIAFLALALQRSTVRLWKIGERQIGIAEKTAETARLSAQAAVLAERAHLFISVKGTNLERTLAGVHLDEGPETAPATPVEAPSVDYVLSNYGRTVALLKEVQHAMIWEAVEGPRGYQAGPARPLETIAPHAESTVMTCRFRGDFSSRDTRSLVAGKRALLLFGEAIFLDVFGHLRGVKWQCRCAGGGFDLIAYQEFEPPAPES
jgi:hypothetical protein